MTANRSEIRKRQKNGARKRDEKEVGGRNIVRRENILCGYSVKHKILEKKNRVT